MSYSLISCPCLNVISLERSILRVALSLYFASLKYFCYNTIYLLCFYLFICCLSSPIECELREAENLSFHYCVFGERGVGAAFGWGLLNLLNE